MRRSHPHSAARSRAVRPVLPFLAALAVLAVLAPAEGCSRAAAPASPPAPVASDSAARAGRVTTSASGGAVDPAGVRAAGPTAAPARPAPTAATYAVAPPTALPGAVRGAERAIAGAARAPSTASSRGRTTTAARTTVSPAAAAEASSVAAAGSLVPILDVLAAIEAGPAADTATPVAAAASRGVQRAQQASLASRSRRVAQRVLAWTSVGLGLAGAGIAIAGGDASTTSAIALAATVTSSLTAIISLRQPSGLSQAAVASSAPATPSPTAGGDSAARTKGDSTLQALAGEAFATRLALDLRVGAQGFAALRDEAVALAHARDTAGAEGTATAYYASLAPRAAAALDVEVPRLLGLARAGAASPNVPETRRPALADASARLEAAWTSWRRDRALHERAERVAIAMLAAR